MRALYITSAGPIAEPMINHQTIFVYL